MRKKNIIFLISLILIVSVLIYKFLDSIPDMGPDYNIREIKFDNNHKLYLKAKVWGINGEGRIVMLSTDSLHNFSDTIRNYKFPRADFLFYKVKGDSLYLFVYTQSKIPPLFKSDIKVKQIELENRDMMNLFRHPDENGVSVFK